MSFVTVATSNGIATVTMNRGKVHAVHSDAVNDLTECFHQLENDSQVRGIILTGQHKFFSFGFDVPELLTYSRKELKDFLIRFTRLKHNLFLYPKPVIAALNGHTVAAGCMLALTADYRLMVPENAKISLNEINIGASVFAGSVEMLRFCAGQRNAELVLTSGKMYSPDEAFQMGLVDELVPSENLLERAREIASGYAEKNGPAYRSIKSLVRKPVVKESELKEERVVDEFIDIWLSERSQAQLAKVLIRS